LLGKLKITNLFGFGNRCIKIIGAGRVPAGQIK